MNTQSPILACHGPGPGFETLAFLLVTCWGLSAVLAVVNLWLIVRLEMTRQLRQAHAAAFLICTVLTVVLFSGGFNWSFWSVVLAAFGIPLLVMGQFGSLLILRRRLRPDRRDGHARRARGRDRGPRGVPR